MTCTTQPSTSINQINMAIGVANLLAGFIAKRYGLPVPALITSKLNFATQTGVTVVSISDGTGTTTVPYTDIPVSGPVLAEFAKVGGIIAATAMAAGVTVGAAGLIPIRVKGVSFAFNIPKPCHVAHALN